MWRDWEVSLRFSFVVSVNFQTALPRYFLAPANFRVSRIAAGGSGGLENQDSVVVKLDFFGLPGGSLIEFIGIAIGGIPRAVEPVKIRFVIGNATAAGGGESCSQDPEEDLADCMARAERRQSIP